MTFSNWTYVIGFSIVYYIVNDSLFTRKVAIIWNCLVAATTAFAALALMRKAEAAGEINVALNIGSLFFNSLLCLAAVYFAATVKARFVDALTDARLEVMELGAQQRHEAENAEMREELARMQRISLAEALSTSISHEVSQPMGSALASVQAAARWLAGDKPRIGEAVAAVNLAAVQLERAGEVLTAVRSLSVRKPQDVSAHDLGKLLKGYLRLVEPDMANAGIVCRLSLPGSGTAPIVEVRPTELGQVFLNIVANAMDALAGAGGPGIIDIAVWDAGDGRAGIRIRDTGPGIAPDLRVKVFERYFTTKAHGTGLGLTLCQEIAGNNGWELELVEDPGEGTEFLLKVPMARLEPGAAQP